MIRNFTKMLFGLVLMMVSFSALAQTTISGNVVDENGEGLIGVNVLVEGTVLGTITDIYGDFSLTVQSAPPFTLVVSYVGYETQRFEIASSTDQINIELAESTLLGQEVVVSASRLEESILTSPVSIEKMGIRDIQEVPTTNFYDAIRNLKGIDVSTQSMTYKSINIRGFSANGNTRTVQLIDGIDNQAPGLNFPVGNIVGINDLDLESVEILPGAASALYGPNAIQGIILMNSKSPFDYQGLSAYAKTGINHVDEEDDDLAAYQDYGLRYAKSFNNKLAFKVTASYLRAEDFIGVDYRDRSGIVERGVEPDPTVEGYRRDPGLRTYNGTNVYGDDVLNPVALGVGSLFPSGDLGDFSVTGYTESEFVDNSTESLKLGSAIHYRLNENLELIGQYNLGIGSTVYTANDRFVLDDFSIWTGKLELRGSNFFARAYTTQEDAGDTYAANALATRILEGTSIPAYIGGFANTYIAGGSIEEAHAVAREAELATRPVVGSEQYNQLYDSIRNVSIADGGAKFLDETSMYHAEAMYNFADKIDFAEIIVGGNFRRYNLKSDGTLFALENIDTGDEFDIDEYGAYLQLKKSVFDDHLGLTGSIRYDKNENFDGQFSPRISAVYTLGSNREHNFRASYQRGFRIPTTQDQFINLDVVTRRLVGSNEALVDQFFFRENEVYNLADLEAVRAGTLAIDQLQPWTDFDFETEKADTYEIGYRGVLNNKLVIDGYYYFTRYTDFIVEVDLIQTASGNTNTGQTPLYSGPAASREELVNGDVETARYGFDVNLGETVDVNGFALGLDYSLPRGFQLGGNVSYNFLRDEDGLRDRGFNPQFNTPEWRYNIKLYNREVVKNVGFNINYRWQDAFLWESAIGEGVIPAYSALDAQVSVKFPEYKSTLKIGGANLLNERYTTSFANPNIGAIYYVGITFDQFLN